MAWQSEMVTILRVLINDWEGQTYAGERLETILIVAGKFVSMELTFSQDFLCDVDALTISPDPTDSATADESFVNLACLKAACILDRGSAIQAAGKGIYIKSQGEVLDTRGAMEGKLALLKQGWCAVYEDAKREYQTSQTGIVAGAAIMTPFRLFSSECGYPDDHRSRGPIFFR